LYVCSKALTFFKNNPNKVHLKHFHDIGYKMLDFDVKSDEERGEKMVNEKTTQCKLTKPIKPILWS